MDNSIKEQLVTSFVDITGLDTSTASFHLEASQWVLEDAIQLHFAHMADAPQPPSQATAATQPVIQTTSSPILPDDDVPPPIPIKQEALYEDVMIYRTNQNMPAVPSVSKNDAFRNFRDEEESRFHSNSIKSSQNNEVSNSNESKNTLASLYRPPFDLMFAGNFEQAKAEGCKQQKWLLVNIQCTTEFLSYTLNRDLWPHEMVKEMIKNNFIFWQAYEDTKEGRKVCNYYNISNFPFIFLIDPLTGQKMKFWQNKVHADRLLEDLLFYMERGPFEKKSNPIQNNVIDNRNNIAKEKEEDEEEEMDLQKAIALSQSKFAPVMDAAAAEAEKDEQIKSLSNNPLYYSQKNQTEGQKVNQSPKMPDSPNFQHDFKSISLPAEPEPSDSKSCKVAVRLPSGKRIQRRFLKSTPAKYLAILCCQNEEDAKNGKRFRLLPALPGYSALDLGSEESLEELGLDNAMISMLWD